MKAFRYFIDFISAGSITYGTREAQNALPSRFLANFKIEQLSL